MKKTTYIIIALAVLPLILVFLSPFIFLLYAEKEGDRHIALSEIMTQDQTLAFDRVTIGIGSYLGMTDKMNFVVRKGDAHRVIFPENISDFISYDVKDSNLHVDFNNADDYYRFFIGDTLLIIETPEIKSVGSDLSQRLIIDGFKLRSEEINFGGSIWLNNCDIDSLSLNDAYFLRLNDSHVSLADVSTSKQFETATFDGRIDSLVITSHQYGSEFTYNDANIGHIRLNPDHGRINVWLAQPLTINNDANGTND